MTTLDLDGVIIGELDVEIRLFYTRDFSFDGVEVLLFLDVEFWTPGPVELALHVTRSPV